ncbi:hypothetical protein DVH05_019349 [Phytophthora capsici]|nr:hypothetical protein DVH05_019349 [Phytophthora capsici]
MTLKRNLVADFEGVVYSGDSGDGEPRCGVQAGQRIIPGPRPQRNDEETKEMTRYEIRTSLILEKLLVNMQPLIPIAGAKEILYTMMMSILTGEPLTQGVDLMPLLVPTTALDAMQNYGWTEPQLYTPYPYMDCPYEMRPDEWIHEDYPGIYEGGQGPTAGALNAASMVLGAFRRFVTPQLLGWIDEETNTYFYENLDARVETQYVKQQAR